MRHRIAVVLGGIVLAVVGVPATPAAAATGTNCVNLYTANQNQPGNQHVIARACISWKDTPTDDKWTLTDQRIWNPPGGVNYEFFVELDDNANRANGSDVLESGGTRIGNRETSVGRSAATFGLEVYTHSPKHFCISMVPSGHSIVANVEPHNC